MCLMGWTTDNGDPDNFLSTFFAKENAVPGPGALNLAFWTDARMQDLLRRQREESDPAKRAPVVKECLDLVLAEVPMVPVAHMRQVVVSAAGFEGFVVQPTGNIHMKGVRAPAK
jgi:ABC-type transport system substrate-binding protein